MLDAAPSSGALFQAGSRPGRSWRSFSALALATVSVLGMLMAFHAVMRGAVEQARLRQQAMAAHAEATWQCKTLRGLHASGACLSQLNGAAPAKAMLQALNLETGQPVP